MCAASGVGDSHKDACGTTSQHCSRESPAYSCTQAGEGAADALFARYSLGNFKRASALLVSGTFATRVKQCASCRSYTGIAVNVACAAATAADTTNVVFSQVASGGFGARRT
jgi:hypothetical protein